MFDSTLSSTRVRLLSISVTGVSLVGEVYSGSDEIEASLTTWVICRTTSRGELFLALSPKLKFIINVLKIHCFGVFQMSKKIRDALDITKVRGGYGRTSIATLNILRGINHRGSGNIVPANTDEQGFTFFTKPNLNLSYDNVNAVRRLSFLAQGGSNSLGAAIRCTLSPLVESTVGIHPGWSQSAMPKRHPQDIRSSVTDDRYAFIPLLTNTLISLSGWPDFVVEAFNSKEGLRKETVSWVDSIADNYGSFDLTANFQNIDGDPITVLFSVWMEYAARVAEGSMNPYPQMIIENEIDYQTRIYRLILDPTKTFVRKIADVGIAFPSAVPNGAAFNYDSDTMFNEENKQIGIRFTCNGVRYNDPITIVNFNRTVATFNSSMRDSVRDEVMVKLKPNEKLLFNYRGYPRINELNELEWWVDEKEYKSTLNTVGAFDLSAIGNLANGSFV
jgi:hypothetical protein